MFKEKFKKHNMYIILKENSYIQLYNVKIIYFILFFRSSKSLIRYPLRDILLLFWEYSKNIIYEIINQPF